MKTFTFTLGLALLLGAAAFAGNKPALTYPTGQFATALDNIQADVTPWGKTVLRYPAGIVMARGLNSSCPVLGRALDAKRPGTTVTLSNGKKALVCCAPCKEEMERDLGKYETFMY